MKVDPERLPHWSRVAFAARCARRVQPLFTEAWPDAAPARVAAVERAITLAEQSAAERRACDGLRAAYIEAIQVAGRALIQHHYPVPLGADEAEDDPGPTGPEAALIASFAAKVAEHAAKAAEAAPGESARPAREALGFALDAIGAAGRPGLVEVLEADFEAVVGSAPRRPWWRFW
jgi:hypothetical protein